MLSLTKQVYLEYHPLIVIMHAKNAKSDGARKILNFLCDVKVILKLSSILPLLECVHALIKIALSRNILYNFVDSMKITHQELYQPYYDIYGFYDPYVKFEDPTFDNFNAIETLTNNNLPMDGFFDLNGGEDVVYLAFLFSSNKYPIYYIGEDGSTCSQPITKEAFKWVVNKVKEECEGIAWGVDV
jgi:hypothetical protein